MHLKQFFMPCTNQLAPILDRILDQTWPNSILDQTWPNSRTNLAQFWTKFGSINYRPSLAVIWQNSGPIWPIMQTKKDGKQQILVIKHRKVFHIPNLTENNYETVFDATKTTQVSPLTIYAEKH